MKDIIVTPYSNRYQQAVTDLILSIQRDEFSLPITAADQPDLSNIPGVYQTGSGNFWTALNGANVVGTIALIDLGNGIGALRKMFVTVSYRAPHSRAASALLTTALNWATGHEFIHLYLGTTSKFLAAHRFYEKNGFTRINRTDLPSSFPIMKVDTVFYGLRLH